MAMKENTTKSMTDKTMRNMIKIDDDDKHESDEQHEDAQQHDVYNHDHSDHFLNLQSTVMNSGLDYVSALVECGSFSSWKSTSPNTGRLQTQDTVKPSLTKHRCSWLVGVRTTTTVTVTEVFSPSPRPETSGMCKAVNMSSHLHRVVIWCGKVMIQHSTYTRNY